MASQPQEARRRLSRILSCWKTQCPVAMGKPCWLRAPAMPLTGMNIHGYFLSEIGLGKSARLLAQAAETQSFPSACINRSLPGRENDATFATRLCAPQDLAVSLTVLGLLELKRLTREICRRQYNIVYPFWELERVPAEIAGRLARFDSLWAPSVFVRDALQTALSRPVPLVRQPLDVPDEDPPLARPRGHLRLLTYFDFDSFVMRKNPEAAVHAFRAAFPPFRRDVRLTVKTRGQHDHGRRAWLAEQARQDPRIRILDATYSAAEMRALMLEHDAFLSLHRSEGFGLGCAEALLAGRSVICTDYGGIRDFINEETGFPVAWSYRAVREGDYPGAEQARWAEPSIEHAAVKLQMLYDAPQEGRRRTRNGVHLLRRQHSLAVIGNVMSRQLAAEGI